MLSLTPLVAYGINELSLVFSRIYGGIQEAAMQVISHLVESVTFIRWDYVSNPSFRFCFNYTAVALVHFTGRPSGLS